MNRAPAFSPAAFCRQPASCQPASCQPASQRLPWSRVLPVIVLLLTLVMRPGRAGELLLQFVDDASGQPLAVRMQLNRADGGRAPIRGGVPAGLGTAIDGELLLRLPTAAYQFQLSRGPEYRPLLGNFALERTSEDIQTLRLKRIVDMEAEGWVAGDPVVAVPSRQLPLRMRAEALAVAGNLFRTAPATVTPRDEPTADEPPADGATQLAIRTDVIAGVAAAKGLAVIGLPPASLEVDGSLDSLLEKIGQGPSSEFIRLLVNAGAGADAEAGELDSLEQRPRLLVLNPFAWDLPIWLASGKVDGITVLGEFLQEDRRVTAWPDSRSTTDLELGGAVGLGKWAEKIYLQVLEAGLRIPPVGASGAGRVGNAVGYNRTYVFFDSQDPPSAGRQADWWRGLWAGRSTVTNGPLLRSKLDGFPPGHTFQMTSGQPLTLQPELQLAIRDPVDYLEILYNGRIVYSARLDEYARQGGRMPALEFDQSGWVLMRVMTKYEDHYRAAITAPWYLELDGETRVSKRAVDFFQAWLQEREAMLLNLPAEQIQAHVPYVRAARDFWARQSQAANAP